jgi:hypothetical protein
MTHTTATPSEARGTGGPEVAPGLRSNGFGIGSGISSRGDSEFESSGSDKTNHNEAAVPTRRDARDQRSRVRGITT